MKKTDPADYVTEAEAKALSGYKRTQLYRYRTANKVRWTAAESGRKVRYHKLDLLKLIGL